eukprot:scaffold22.g6117.t1
MATIRVQPHCQPPALRRRPGMLRRRCADQPPPEPPSPQAPAAAEDEAKKSEEYSDVMSKRMGAVLTYRHEDGMNYTRILDDLIVGSCLQTPEDVDRLVESEDVRTVLQLQEDSDMAYFSLDLAPIKSRVEERGDVAHVRHRIRDFDPFSLRMELPGAVALLARQAAESGGTSYIHCTAGLGRAPAVALAYMWWYKGYSLEDAFELLTGLRPCSPKTAAIRAAAADVLFGAMHTRVTLAVHRRGLAQEILVAGLDVGWGQQLPLAIDRHRRFAVTRHLPAGTFQTHPPPPTCALPTARPQYKFIVDGNWTYSADHPTLLDGGNVNNYVVVPFLHPDPLVHAARERVLSEGGQLTPAEREAIQRHLATWPGVGEGGGTTGNLAVAPGRG